ncbi:MAG: FecR family protein, partial [Clostridiales bacterium]|nr:FecR family protein [Clostridiales bacterium]
MKVRGKIAALLAVILVFCGLQQAEATEMEESYRNVKVLETEGTADLLREELEMPVYEQLVIQGGDIITTGEDGQVSLILDDDKYAIIEESSEVEFQLEGKKNKGTIHIYLNEGAIYNDIENPLEEEDAYEIETPDGVMAVRGTKFRISITTNEDGTYRETSITVFEGKVYVSVKNSANEETVVEAGEEAIIEKHFDKSGNEIIDEDEDGEQEPYLRKYGSDTSTKTSINYSNLPQYILDMIETGEIIIEDENALSENAASSVATTAAEASGDGSASESEAETEEVTETETGKAAGTNDAVETGTETETELESGNEAMSETGADIEAESESETESESESETGYMAETEPAAETELEADTETEVETETGTEAGTEAETELETESE